MQHSVIDFEHIPAIEFYGVNDVKLALISVQYPLLKMVARGQKIQLSGQQAMVFEAKEKIETIINIIDKFKHISFDDYEKIIASSDAKERAIISSPENYNDIILIGNNGKIIRAKTQNQKKMVAAIENNDIVFAIGPAGTGKTYTSVALAVKALKTKTVKKIILTRPAVEAGESLGFLPGDLKEKIDPYLRPLYDALEDMLPFDKVQYYITNNIIEIAPLAYMRGRTLNNCFVILDEAQNSNDLQIKMFLTRLGPQAKAVINGDPTQIDLPKNQTTGLQHACSILKNIDGIKIITLDEEDVVRHKLVKKIIEAYKNSKK
ncbi:MAG: PhoH family protein [Sediminibacterium sp.]|nr:PhoH family protein [Sediminibacterium sp.]